MLNAKELTFYKQCLTEMALATRKVEEGLERDALRPFGGEASGSLSNSPFHQADTGSADYAGEVELSLLENESKLIAEIEDALLRLETGKFGICANCGAEIAMLRLNAIPYTKYCTNCAQDEQKQIDAG